MTVLYYNGCMNLTNPISSSLLKNMSTTGNISKVDEFALFLKITPFEIIDGPLLEDRLKNMDQNHKRLKTIKSGLRIIAGNGVQIQSIVEGADYILQRDYPELFRLQDVSSGKGAKNFVPEYFLTKATNYPGPEVDARIRENLTEKKIGELDMAKRVYRGDKPELDLYTALKKYFELTNDHITIFHGTKLYDMDITKQTGQNPLKEKDFILVNGSRKYVMVIEAKKTFGASDSLSKSYDQLRGVKCALESWFGVDLDESWHFVPAIYCQKNISSLNRSFLVFEGMNTISVSYTVSNKNTHLAAFQNNVFRINLRNYLSYKKVIYIYLHPHLKNFQITKESFKSGHKISCYLQKTLFCQKKSKLL